MADGEMHEEGIQSLREDSGSMAFKLARMESGEAPTAEQQEAEAARQEEPQGAEGKTQEELDAEASAAAEAAKEAKPEEGQPGAAEAPKRKFETLEDYDKAYKEAETRMHSATEETAKERKAREALAAEKAAMEEELKTLKEREATRAAEEAAAAAKPKIKEKYSQALKKIAAIQMVKDPETGELRYPEDYNEQVAEAWADTGLDPAEVAREAAKIAREELRKEQEQSTATRAAEDEEANRARLRADAEKLAADDGLNMTPGSADYRLFYGFVNDLAADPAHEMRDKPFAEQVKWASQGVRKLLGDRITDAEREAARRLQDENAVLETGITRREPNEPPRQRSMQEILQAQR